MKTSSIMFRSLAVIGLLFVLNGCYMDKSLPVAAQEFEGTVSFEKDILPIFADDCSVSGCHDGTIKPNLSAANAFTTLTGDGYIDIDQPNNSKLYKWMNGMMSISMPPSGTNSKDAAIILAWIKNGSPNN